MSERFRCTYSYKTVFDIDYELLKNDGISALLFDIDNTLASYADSVPDEKTADLIKKLCGRGFKIFFLSNNSGKRVGTFAESVGVPCISRAAKPLVFNIRRAMRKLGAEKSETVLIGDQLFTDIWGANRAGIKSVLVEPVSANNEDKFVAFKRRFEKMIKKD